MVQAPPAYCPICLIMLPDTALQRRLDSLQVACPVCGDFRISGTAEAIAASRVAGKPHAAAKVSFALRRMQEHAQWPLLDSAVLRRILDEVQLPSPREQADNLVLWVGRCLRDEGPHAVVELVAGASAAIMGAIGFDGERYILTALGDRGLVAARPKHGTEGNPWLVGLTFDGWERYYELVKETVESRIAFMAMPFGNETLDRVFRDCFRPAVDKTGFSLRRIDDNPPAGLIDNRLRVEIRRARFLIADLTNANAGAYWEAGFCEGLGRPVIYTCEETYFREKKTHFDTNHSLTIPWSVSDLSKAERDLKSAIRATLPAQAKPPTDDEVV